LNGRGSLTVGEKLMQDNKGGQFCIAFCDIDNFKRINDSHGHDAGDEVLRHITGIIKKEMNGYDIRRWGGEEFMIVARNITKTMALDLAESIRRDICDEDYDPVPELTVSIGIAGMSPNDNILELYKRVDKALYHAKKSGRNCVFFSTD
jgi:diguanylate cyclase (GGDEF)-like protein